MLFELENVTFYEILLKKYLIVAENTAENVTQAHWDDELQ